MHANFALIYLFYLSVAIILDVAANFLVKLSDGFQHKLLGFAAIGCVLAAFTALSFAIKGIPLSVAYGIWGGLGLIATALVGAIMFAERLHFSAWLGIVLVMAGVILLRFA